MESYIHEWVAQLGDKDQVVAFRAYKNLEDTATRAGAPGLDSRRADLAATLIAELDAKGEPPKNKNGKVTGEPGPLYPAGVRNQICRLLSYIAGANEVPALVKELGDQDVREMARYALDRNTSEAASDALIESLDQIGAVFRAGAVNALGKRQGPKVLAALQKIATEDPVNEIRMVAVEALAHIADPSNADFVMKATQCTVPGHKRRAYKAAARLAGTLADAGHKNQAHQLYEAIQSSDAEKPQKKAASIALKNWGKYPPRTYKGDP